MGRFGGGPFWFICRFGIDPASALSECLSVTYSVLHVLIYLCSFLHFCDTLSVALHG